MNLSKTKIMIFEKRPTLNKYTFHLDTVTLEQTKNYTYLGINMNATGNRAVNETRKGVHFIP